jgi:hypothetical protein
MYLITEEGKMKEPTMRNTLRTVILAMYLVGAGPLWAADEKGRFIEFSEDVHTKTFDLSTVRIIQLGRFAIIATMIDNPDVMRLELKVLDALRPYCARADGHYPYPTSANLFTLGPPDCVKWDYPYKKIADSISIASRGAYLRCKEPGRSEGQLYSAARTYITNGSQSKELYDCKRGLWGLFFNKDDDPIKVFMQPVLKDTIGFEYYLGVCRAVTHEEPYIPK